MASESTGDRGTDGPGAGDDGLPAALADPDDQLEPFDWYREMRTEAPVRYDERRGAWDVFRYETVSSVLRDPETFSSDRVIDPERDEPPTMLSEDPPRHTRLRSAVEERFRPDAIEPLEPEIREMAADLVDDALEGDDRMDVVGDLARWLPTVTIAALLGIPPADRERFKEWSDTIVSGPQLTGGDRDLLERRQTDAAEEMREYVSEVMLDRAAEPQDDLVSTIVHAEDLSEADMRGVIQLLLIAGNVTTTNLIANAVWCFADEGVDEAVARDPEALETAIEEVLRYRSPVQWTNRVATEPVEIEDCGGRVFEIDEGEFVRAWIGSANRDADVFDRPETFVPDRQDNPHLGFGRGIHVCLGAGLARLEARVALEVLYDRIESVRLVETDYEPVASHFLYGVQQLPIEYDRRDARGAPR